jgi:hypothetical protein
MWDSGLSLAEPGRDGGGYISTPQEFIFQQFAYYLEL